MSLEEKQSRIPKTLCIIHDYVDRDSASIVESYLVEGVNYSHYAGKYGVVELITDEKDGLYGACEGGYVDIVKLMLRKNTTYLNFDYFEACKGGFVHKIGSILSEYFDDEIDWINCLYFACKGGNMDIVGLMMSKCVDDNEVDWSRCLRLARKGGNLNVINLMTSKEADNWNSGLTYLFRGNNIYKTRTMRKRWT